MIRRRHQLIAAGVEKRLSLARCPAASGPLTTIYSRFVRWARRGDLGNLFRDLAGNWRSANTQTIYSTHVKWTARQRVERGGEQGICCSEAAQHEGPCTRRCSGPSSRDPPDRRRSA